MKGFACFVLLLFVQIIAAQNLPTLDSVACNSVTSGTIKDIDGNEYNTITIGNQVWMKENLNVTRYNNGDEIPTTNPDTLDLTNYEEPKYQWAYESKERYAHKYGRLYTWYVVTDERNVCPTGWHVPTDDEFCILENTILPGTDINCDIEEHRGENLGNYMKETCTYWLEPRTTADNRSGFSVLPAGIRSFNGIFSGLTHYGYFWTTDEFNPELGRSRRFYFNMTDVSRASYMKGSSLSVRCIKD